jgi:hypothetical protein
MFVQNRTFKKSKLGSLKNDELGSFLVGINMNYVLDNAENADPVNLNRKKNDPAPLIPLYD